MLERREYTVPELLAWCRFTSMLLLGSALAYTREREGTVDQLIDFAGQRLSALYSGTLGVESAMLGLRLSLEALGAEVRTSSQNPEEGEIVAGNLPSERLTGSLSEHFDLDVRPADILALCGLGQDDLNRLYDLLGTAAAGPSLAYEREPLDGDQRLTLRA